MPQIDYDRYSILRNADGTTVMMPFIPIPINASDKYIRWNREFSRMDKLSQKYYGNVFYDFIILYANPEYVNEFDIPDGTLIRIPFPHIRVKQIYENALKQNREQ